jgi:hypothetical protein
LQDIEQLAHPGMGDEADQDVHLITGRQLAAQFRQQRWRALASREQPGQRQTSIGLRGRRRVAMHRLQQLQRCGQRIDFCRRWCKALTRIHQQRVGQFQLALQLLGAVALQVIKYLGDLRGDRLGQARWRVVSRQGSERAAVLVRGADKGAAQRFGE